MRSIIFRVVVAATAALTVACSSTDSVAPATPTASARAVSANADGVGTVKRLIDQHVWVSCLNDGAGEAVRVTGDLRYDFQNTQDASGVYHLSIKSNTSGLTGVGLTSGTLFRGMMSERVDSRATDYLNEDVRTADMIRFVAPGSNESYALMVSSHFIVDQGSYVLWDQTWNEVCR